MPIRSLTRFLPAALVACAVTLSCSRDSVPTAPGQAPAFDDHGPGGSNTGIRTATRKTAGLVLCRPLPYAADTATIGPAGGAMRVGPHYLVFPAGALSSTVTIIAEAPGDSVRSVRLSPAGLTFEDAYLVLNYSGCMDRPGAHAHRIAYTDDALNVLYYVESYDRSQSRQVVGEIHHFSRYAVGW